MPLRLLFSISMLLSLSACANKQLQPYVDNYQQFDQSIYVIDHGIHTALVVESKPLLAKLGLQQSLFRNFRFVEVGRGDAGFYQQKDPQFSTTLKALFLSTPAILHLSGYQSPPTKRYPRSHTLEVRLSRSGLDKLLSSVAQSFVLKQGQAIELAIGRDENSRFYEADGSYHLFYTCNNWTADMMQQADYPIAHRWAFFAGSVMRQIEGVQRKLGISCGQLGTHRCEVSPQAPNKR